MITNKFNIINTLKGFILPNFFAFIIIWITGFIKPDPVYWYMPNL